MLGRISAAFGNGAAADSGVRLLGDHPASEGEDRLGFGVAAKSLAELILGSRRATPFTLGIEASWGMGKTSMMRRLRSELELAAVAKRLPEGTISMLEFNPWTMREGEVLEGLLKTVMDSVKGPLRSVLDDENVKKTFRLAAQVAAELVHMGNVADAVWEGLARDPSSRSELRELMSKAMGRARKKNPDRLVCVFVDDLDRCSPKSVFELFEAIKVYLDVDGLAFVIAYDHDVVSGRILQAEQYSDKVTGREYLEKIIQVVYPIHQPNETQAENLVRGLLRDSGTEGLIGERADELGRWSYQNPRRIKRLINTVIIQHEASGGEEETLGLAEAAFEMFHGDFVREQTEPAKTLKNVRDYAVLQAIRGDPEREGEQEKRIAAFAQRMNQPGASLATLFESFPKELVAVADNWRLVEIAEELGDDDDVDRVMRRIGERLPPAPTREARVNMTTLDLVLDALNRPGYQYRTAEGIATDAGLTVSDVLAVVQANPQAIRESARPDRRGRPLFAAREREREPE